LRFSVFSGTSDEPLPGMVLRTKARIPAGKFEYIRAGFSIRNLPSQAYELVAEYMNHEGKVFIKTTRKFYVIKRVEYAGLAVPASADFERTFNFTEAQLNEYIPSLWYIATPTEQSFISALKTYTEKKNFFFHFWKVRASDKEPINKIWREHLARLTYANEHYKTISRKGWQTDRGRILIQYGMPNNIQQNINEPDKYPYEIWQYNTLGFQQGVIFVFYDRDRSTNNWPLLHSTKNGEFNNNRWRLDLLRQTIGPAGGGVDPEQIMNNSNFRQMFNDPLNFGGYQRY
jgi:GWxTD domain-containing protein